MPNYVKNEVWFFGQQKRIDELKKFVASYENPFDFDKIIPMPANIYRGSLGQKEREFYGENNWYDWSRENWGTKWNSWKAKWGREYVTFYTAWSTPKPIFDKLAIIYPDLRIRVAYADEDIGNNCGIIEYLDGEIEEEDKHSDIEFACSVWGYDPDEYRKELEEE